MGRAGQGRVGLDWEVCIVCHACYRQEVPEHKGLNECMSNSSSVSVCPCRNPKINVRVLVVCNKWKGKAEEEEEEEGGRERISLPIWGIHLEGLVIRRALFW